jgi:hypothetical protein
VEDEGEDVQDRLLRRRYGPTGHRWSLCRGRRRPRPGRELGGLLLNHIGGSLLHMSLVGVSAISLSACRDGRVRVEAPEAGTEPERELAIPRPGSGEVTQHSLQLETTRPCQDVLDKYEQPCPSDATAVL